MDKQAVEEAWGEELQLEIVPYLSEDGSTYKCPSPFEEYPGFVILPAVLDIHDYLKWWRLAQEDTDPKTTHHLETLWSSRHHLVKQWKLQHITAEQIGVTLNVPDTAIATWIMVLTQPLITEATELPKFSGASLTTTKDDEN